MPDNRRQFLKVSTAAAGAVAAKTLMGGARIAGSDEIRLGLIGCGSWGVTMVTAALVEGGERARLVAIADVFDDVATEALEGLRKGGLSGNVSARQVADTTVHSGFSGGRRVIEGDVDVVLLCEPPYFRPHHLALAVEHGRHVYCETPAAVDPIGLRVLREEARKAKDKRLAIVSGLMPRRTHHYRKSMLQVHQARIGRALTVHSKGLEGRAPAPKLETTSNPDDLEFQLRNWRLFSWLSGDFLVERHTESTDLMAWGLGDRLPRECHGSGGRQVRGDRQLGNIYDHFDVTWIWEPEKPATWKRPKVARSVDEPGPGPKAFGSFRQWDFAATDVSTSIVGTRGACYPRQGVIVGEDPWSSEEPPAGNDAKRLAFRELYRSRDDGNPVNEGELLYRATFIGVMGRMAAYSGATVNTAFVQKDSEWKLGPDIARPGDLEKLNLNAKYPAEWEARPGLTRLK